MSELKVYKPYANRDGDVLIYHKGDGDLMLDDEDEIYLKSEADKVIAELKQKINEAQTELELWRDGSIISEAHQKELDGKRHSDYKRCLAMAMWCGEKWADIATPYGKSVWYNKWQKRWLELAEKFKDSEH